MPSANFTMDLQKEYPLLFAPFGFVRFEEFQYCEDGSGCVTICSQRNLRSRCKEDIVACNGCEDEIPVVEKKCLGFQGLYRPAYTCQIKNGSEIIEEFTSPYGSYNSGEFNLYPRMGNETDISCFLTDILGRKVEDKESGCPANLVRSSKEKISAFETCTRDSAATLPLEFNEAANLDLPDVLGASANLLNSCVCPEGKVWSFLQNWCIPRSSCSSMEFEVPVPCETRAEVHKANGWYPLTCKNEEDYFPKSCMVFNEIYNLCFEVDDNGDIDRDGRLDIIDMTAEPVKPDNGLGPGQFYSPWEPVDSWSYQDYYNESITYQRTSLDKYTYEFKEDNCFPIRAELYFPIDHASFEGYSRVLLEENNWSHFSYYCRCMEAEGDSMCDPGQMVRFVCEDFPEDYGNTDSYDDYGSIVYPSYPEYGNYEDWEYNNYDSDSLQAMAPKIISNVMDQLIWGQLSKYSCMEMFLLQRYHSAGTYSCTDAIKNVYTECLKTSFSMAGEEIATMLAETESKAIEYFFCKKNLTPMSVENYFSYWDESVWDVFYGGIVDKYNLYDLDSGRKRRSHETNLIVPYAQATTPGYVDYDWSETSGNDSDDDKRKLTKDDVYQLIKIGAHIVESNLATLVTSHAVNISAASVANGDTFYSGMCTLWGDMQKSVDKAAKEGIQETIHGDSIAEMLSVFNLTDSECYEIKEKIEYISPEIGMTWELTSSFNPFCENKEQWPKLSEIIKEEMGPFELRCEIHQFADQVVQCFNEYILGRVPHGDDYWKNILRAGVCSYSRISRNCLGMPWVEADIEELYEEVLDDMFRYDEEHVFNAFAMIALDKIKDFPTEFDEFIHWAWAEAQRFLPEEITREIEIYVGNPAEKLLKFIEELENGLLINKSGIERPICNMGTQCLTFLKTILFEDETTLCSFMSSAIETHKALLYQTHANFENFSKFCTFVVEKFSDMFEDMFLREYIKKMLLEEGVIPPIFINIALNMFDTKTAYEIRKFSKWEKQECTYLPHWSEWSQCSETCDGGYRHRAQICMDKTMSQVSNILCGPDLLFSTSEPCNTFECALPCSVMANIPDEFNITTYKVDCKDRKLTVFPFSYENGRLRVNGVNYPVRRIESFDFCNNYFEDSQWEAIEDFIGQSHKTKEFNFSHNKFETLPVSVLQRLTKGAELNMDGNEICKFDCEGFDLRQFSGKLNLCLQNNPISSVPFEFIPAIGYFNKFEYDDGVLGRNKST